MTPGAALVSIHAPRAGSDLADNRTAELAEWFQSTLPARGATPDQSAAAVCQAVSIHAPRAGSDPSRMTPSQSAGGFNPRSPRGERLGATGELPRPCNVSIHAPRAGSDGRRRWKRRWPASFNPRSPRGERLAVILRKTRSHVFQSTLPARGATWPPARASCRDPVSIHAPRAGSDPSIVSPTTHSACFNPRSPRGERRGTLARPSRAMMFQSTLPARGATCFAPDWFDYWAVSIHAPRAGSDRVQMVRT